jgi:serine/threonine-protein kinase
VTDPVVEAPPPRKKTEVPAPKSSSASTRLDSIFESEPESASAPKAASPSSIFDPEPSAIPPSQAVPASGAKQPETTLKPQHTFGPDAEDGQPMYILHELLPADEMGVLYRASERADGRQFAVRFLAGQAGEEQTQAIEREVEKLIALPHPNILHVQGSGRRKNRLYLSMDLIQAPSLSRAKIHDLYRICAIVRDAAAAVHYAHEEQIMHGDLNPDNILVAVGEDGGDHALVKDFHLGFLVETLIGPPPGSKEARKPIRNRAYLPPEQIDAVRPKLTVVGDVYGLGATLYGVLAGKPPFEEKDPAQLRRKVMFSEPPPLNKVRPDVPEALIKIIRRSMAKETGLRYASVQDFVDALNKFLETA